MVSGTLILPLLFSQTFPTHTVDINLDFNPMTSLSQWVFGYLPKYSRSTPSVWMLDRTGREIIPRTELSFPDATRIEIKAVTADRSGNLFASAEVWSYGQAASGIIVRMNRDQSPALVIRTNDFLGIALAVSPSNEIWCFGLPLLFQTTRTTTQEYQTVLRFSHSGNLISSVLPRSGFGKDTIPTEAYGDLGFPMIWASKNRIGVYSAKARRWVELDSTTGATLLDIFVTPPTAADGTVGAPYNMGLLDDDNSVYMSFATNHFGTGQINGLFWLDEDSRRWIPAPERSKSSEYGLLSGGDGKNLIFRGGSRTFGWFDAQSLKPVRQEK
jgi:hypothetical protein